MALTPAQQTQLDQLKALQARQAVTDTEALITALNDAGASLVAKCDVVLDSLDEDSALATDVHALRNVLMLSGGNLTARLAPLKAKAAPASAA